MVNEHGGAYEPHPNLRIDLLQKGWRPAIGWIGAAIIAGVGVRIVLGLPMPDLAPLVAALVPVMQVALQRSVEKFGRVA